MSLQRTYAMIKPDAVRAKNSGNIIARIEKEGFTIVGMKLMHMSKAMAEAFYAVHRERPFYGELVEFITSGPVVALVLEKNNAVLAWRDLMGATNPAQAAEGTIRKLYATSIGENAAHGSDSEANAAGEIKLVFPELA